jgi:hypothetical protein
MNRACLARKRSLDDIVNAKVTFLRWRRTDANRLIRALDVQSVGISFGVDCNRTDTHSLGGLNDAASNLTPIGD